MSFNPNTCLKAREKEIWDALSGRTFVPTKFLHGDTLRTAGLFECTQGLLTAGRLGAFIELSAPTWKGLTLEFISTLKFHTWGIAFRCCNEKIQYQWPYLRDVFGIQGEATDEWKAGLQSEDFFTF